MKRTVNMSNLDRIGLMQDALTNILTDIRALLIDITYMLKRRDGVCLCFEPLCLGDISGIDEKCPLHGNGGYK
jgi:hypothetical protein